MRPLLSLSERLLARLAINLEDLMFQWADFEAAAPELAAQGRELIESFRFVLAGTIRRDGTPRISPVEAHIVGGHLMLVMISGTRKAGDLLRDPRILLNSPVTQRRVQAARACGRDPGSGAAGNHCRRDQGRERLAAAARMALLLHRHRGCRLHRVESWGDADGSLEPRPWPRPCDAPNRRPRRTRSIGNF